MIELQLDNNCTDPNHICLRNHNSDIISCVQSRLLAGEISSRESKENYRTIEHFGDLHAEDKGHFLHETHYDDADTSL